MASGLCSGQAAHLCPCQLASPAPVPWPQAALEPAGQACAQEWRGAPPPQWVQSGGGSWQDPHTHRKAEAIRPMIGRSIATVARANQAEDRAGARVGRELPREKTKGHTVEQARTDSRGATGTHGLSRSDDGLLFFPGGPGLGARGHRPLGPPHSHGSQSGRREAGSLELGPWSAAPPLPPRSCDWSSSPCSSCRNLSRRPGRAK